MTRTGRNGALCTAIAGILAMGASLLPAVAAGAADAAEPARAATDSTTIRFTTLPDGTTLTDQFAAQGIRFGRAADLGAPRALADATDCGPPRVVVDFEDAAWHYALTEGCRGSSSGTVAAFASPRRSVSVAISYLEMPNGRLIAYDRSGARLAQAMAFPGESASIERAAADIAFLAIQSENPASARIAFDSVAFDRYVPQVVAVLPTPAPVKALGVAVLDARGSSGASSYRWDLNGDGRADVTCGAGEPVLTVRSTSVGRRTVQLTVVSASGATATTSKPLVVAGGALPAKTKKKATETAVCTSKPPKIPNVDNVSGPVYVGCAKKVVFGIVEAQGCLEQVTRREDVPAAERRVVDEYFATQGLSAVEKALCVKNHPKCPEFVAKAKALELWVSDKPVKINGLEFRPVAHGSIVVYPMLQRVVSAAAVVRIGKYPIKVPSALDLNLKSQTLSIGTPKGRADLFSYDASKTIKSIGGFALTGTATVSMRRFDADRFTELGVRIALPAAFKVYGGSPPSGATSFRVSNDRSLSFDRLSITVPKAELGAVSLSNLTFTYNAAGDASAGCPKNWWKATANVYLGSVSGKSGFILSPPPSQNGIAFCAGKFRSAGGKLVFGGPIPRPQLFPGVFLDEVNFAVGLDPTLVRGGGRLSVADLTDVSGTLLMVFPSPSVPYRLTAEDAGGDLAPLRGRTLVSTTVALGGSAGVKAPVIGRVPLGNAYFMYSYPDYAAFGGKARVVVPGLALEGGIDGELAASKRLFTTHGYAKACIAGLACGLGVDAWVTSTGAVVCGTIGTPFGTVHPGAGYRWGDTWPTIWLVDGCKPSRYWVNVRAGSNLLRNAAGAPTVSFTVAKGERAKNVRIDGVGGAPHIEVRGPRGEVVRTSGETLTSGSSIRILRQPEGKVTWVGVENGPAGRYTVTTLPGSPQLGGLASTRDNADRVTATVRRKGAKQALRYRGGGAAGERTVLFERGAGIYRQLGVASKARGTIRFRPAAGPAGKRDILAQTVIDGVQTPPRVIGTFTAPAPQRTGRPGKATARHKGKVVTASWKKAPGAVGYDVVLRTKSGLQRLAQVRGTKVTIRKVPRSQGGIVMVRARGVFGDRGAVRKAKFKALAPEPTRLRPFSQLGKGKRR